MNKRTEKRIYAYCRLSEKYLNTDVRKSLGYLSKASRVYAWATRESKADEQINEKVRSILEKLCSQFDFNL